MLPYSAEALFALYAEYNTAIRPLPALALFLAAGAVALSVRAKQDRNRPIAGILAAGWLWTGAAWHLAYFGDLNFAAPLYGALFIVQGLLVVHAGWHRNDIDIRFERRPRQFAGCLIVVVSVLLLPLLDWLSGTGWMDARFALLAPGPTAGLTAGLLLMSAGNIPIRLIVIPVLWLTGSGFQAWVLDMPQDYLLTMSGILAGAAAIPFGKRTHT